MFRSGRVLIRSRLAAIDLDLSNIDHMWLEGIGVAELLEERIVILITGHLLLLTLELLHAIAPLGDGSTDRVRTSLHLVTLQFVHLLGAAPHGTLGLSTWLSTLPLRSLRREDNVLLLYLEVFRCVSDRSLWWMLLLVCHGRASVVHVAVRALDMAFGFGRQG